MAKRVAAAPPEVDSESDDSEGESTKRLYDKSNETMIAEWKGDVARLLELPWAKGAIFYADSHRVDRERWEARQAEIAKRAALLEGQDGERVS